MTDSLDAVWADFEQEVDSQEVERARDAAGEDEVVCLECARALGQITEQHLQIHDLALEEYEAKHPEAPIYPDDPARHPGRQPGFSHPEETKQKIADSTSRNHERGVYE